MSAAILGADAALLLWIQDALRFGWLNPVMSGITCLGNSGIIWIVVALALMCFKKTRWLGVTCAVSMALGLLVTNLVIKNWVARVRPYEAVEGLQRIIAAQKDWSFPSGHATNGLACAWVLFRRAPRRYGVPALALALLICYTRLYVGVHYPTDVLGGAAIGIGSACIALAVMPGLIRRVEKRLGRAIC